MISLPSLKPNTHKCANVSILLNLKFRSYGSFFIVNLPWSSSLKRLTSPGLQGPQQICRACRARHYRAPPKPLSGDTISLIVGGVKYTIIDTYTVPPCTIFAQVSTMFNQIILLSSHTHRQLTYLLSHSVLNQHAASQMSHLLAIYTLMKHFSHRYLSS